MPFFSVIISTYNRAELLLDSIHSVLNQSFIDFEITVVDDGSTDQTKELIKSEFQSNPKLHYIFQQNTERGEARNTGMRNSKGKYLVFLDSDDLMKENHLAVLNNTITLFPEYGLYATRYEFFNEKGIIKNSISPVLAGSYDINIVLLGNPFAVNFCVKNDLDNINYFESNRIYSTMEDWMFLIANISKNKLLVINDITIFMRDHPKRSMKSEATLLSEKRLLATKRIIETVNLTEENIKKIWLGTYRFCAIHYYIDCNRNKSIYYWKLYAKTNGMTIEALKLIIKFIIGKKIIRYIQ